MQAKKRMSFEEKVNEINQEIKKLAKDKTANEFLKKLHRFFCQEHVAK